MAVLVRATMCTDCTRMRICACMRSAIRCACERLLGRPKGPSPGGSGQSNPPPHRKGAGGSLWTERVSRKRDGPAHGYSISIYTHQTPTWPRLRARPAQPNDDGRNSVLLDGPARGYRASAGPGAAFAAGWARSHTRERAQHKSRFVRPVRLGPRYVRQGLMERCREQQCCGYFVHAGQHGARARGGGLFGRRITLL